MPAKKMLSSAIQDQINSPFSLRSLTGLTLVELIITISLTAIVSVPVSLLLSRQLGAALGARDTSIGMQLARAEMERLDSLNDFFAIASQAAAPVPGFPAYTRSVTVACLLGNCVNTGTGSQGVKRITIVVTKTGSTNPFATLVTYRTKHVFFGG